MVTVEVEGKQVSVSDLLEKLEKPQDLVEKAREYKENYLRSDERCAELCNQLHLQSQALSVVKESYDDLRNLHDSAVIEIGKACGQDLTDEPRAKWAVLVAHNLHDENMKLRKALVDILENKTEYPNATVKRMLAIAENALKKGEDNEAE